MADYCKGFYGMITLHQILKHYSFDPSQVKLVRHSNAEYPILETYQNNREKFEAYQSFQKPGKFAGASHIAVFAPTRGTTALFLGLWDIKGSKECSDFTEEIHSTIDKHGFPSLWHTYNEWYELERNDRIDELSERLVIDWGKSRTWVQRKDKEVLEIKGENSIGDFESYDQVRLSFHDLKKLMSQSVSNFSWVSALSSVNGVYLIRDKSTGHLYVGSAYGEDGIYGRWSVYSRNGHGGNKNLKALNSTNFEFSILEIVPATTSVDEVVRREMRWQERLGTRDFGGLNRR
jgi:hypothetical protein